MPLVDRAVDIFLSVVLAAGGFFAIFKFFGKAWMDASVQKRLESFKHENSKELARMKVSIETTLSGSLKLQEEEFKVLPEAWDLMNEAYGRTEWVAHPCQEYPDLSALAPIELEELMGSRDYSESQKERLRHATSGFQHGDTGRNAVYQEIDFWKRLHVAKVAIGTLQRYVSGKALFFTTELKQQFEDLVPMLYAMTSALETSQQFKLHEIRSEAWKKFEAEARPAHGALNLAVKRRLLSHGETKAGASALG